MKSGEQRFFILMLMKRWGSYTIGINFELKESLELNLKFNYYIY